MGLLKPICNFLVVVGLFVQVGCCDLYNSEFLVDIFEKEYAVTQEEEVKAIIIRNRDLRAVKFVLVQNQWFGFSESSSNSFGYHQIRFEPLPLYFKHRSLLL